MTAPPVSLTMDWRVVTSRLPAIVHGMEARANALVAKAAMDIEREAKTRAPVDTGNLRNSIQASRVAMGHWKVVVGADYGYFVEWGTVHMAAQPFLRPAINAVQPNFQRALRSLTAGR
jgi:HK97 gp10 family phage protein